MPATGTDIAAGRGGRILGGSLNLHRGFDYPHDTGHVGMQ